MNGYKKAIDIPEEEREWMNEEGLNKLNELRKEMQRRYSKKVDIGEFKTNKEGDKLEIDIYATKELLIQVTSEFDDILEEHGMFIEGSIKGEPFREK